MFNISVSCVGQSINKSINL